MKAHRDWFIRRLKRTGLLIAQHETRNDMLRYLARNTGGLAIVHARGYARTRLRGIWS